MLVVVVIMIHLSYKTKLNNNTMGNYLKYSAGVSIRAFTQIESAVGKFSSPLTLFTQFVMLWLYSKIKNKMIIVSHQSMLNML